MGLPEHIRSKLHHRLPSGLRGSITDVDGVAVGHVTLDDPSRDIHTGVTAVFPHCGDIFHDKVPAGVAVLNGFGKTAGLVQVEELGSIESPIVLTNTLNVGTAYSAVVRYMLAQCADIGITAGTVNPVICECNDGKLNDIRGMHVTEQDVMNALNNAGTDAAEGSVGAGRGMCCLGLKGGIGTASRLLKVDGKFYTVGALVLSNFGTSGSLMIGGDRISEHPSAVSDSKDLGSIIILIGTDLPLSDRQLRRMAMRSAISLGRTGSRMGSGSGDIAIAFSTAESCRIHARHDRCIYTTEAFAEERMDKVFDAAIEAVEESIISSLWHADSMDGIRGKHRDSLRDLIEDKCGKEIRDNE